MQNVVLVQWEEIFIMTEVEMEALRRRRFAILISVPIPVRNDIAVRIPIRGILIPIRNDVAVRIRIGASAASEKQKSHSCCDQKHTERQLFHFPILSLFNPSKGSRIFAT
ncbi:MAG: hypothetical protein C4523_20940 [Myxococcales bacterium]|nr:MAG: hypothetical protein C4523_20940 [Myxococcales bacterium]